MLTSAQKLLVKNDILNTPALNSFPNNPDGAFEIAAAYNAVGALDSFDAINKEDKAIKKRIFKRCLFIIDTCTKNLYDQLTDDELDED